MPTALPEQIAQTLITRLEAITTGNGYAFTVRSVDRVSRDAREWTPRNLCIGVAQAAEVRNPAMDHEGNPAAIGYQLAFNIHAFVRQSDDATTQDATTENAMVAAIKQAVAGTTDWHNFGGLSVDADWGSCQPFISGQGDHAGATLPLFVFYRISETDPFETRA